MDHLKRRKVLLLGIVAISFATLLLFRDFSYSPLPPVIEERVVPKTVTQTVTSLLPAPTVYKDVVVQPAPIIFALLMWSKESAIEGSLLIKSILIHSSSPTEFHIICDQDARTYLESRFALVTRPYHNVHVYYYQPSWKTMQDRVDREGSIKTDHSAGLPGLMKLFIHELLPPTVKKAIYVDTDAIFIVDPTLLWNTFDGLKPTASIVMSSHPDQDAEEWHHASRICSCVMLLDLEKLRESRLMDSELYRAASLPALAPAAFRSMYGPLKKGEKYDNVRLGDQGYWWAIIDYYPEIFEPLSLDFEVTSCLMDMYMTGLGDEARTEEEERNKQIHVQNTPQQGIAVLPKLLHFNCLHGTAVYMEWSGWDDPNDSLTQRWGPALKFHHGFKWIWLNRHGLKEGERETTAMNGEPDLRSTVIDNVVFADEL